MAEYTVTAAEHKRDLPARDGYRPSQVIKLRLSDGANEHEAEWITATTTDDSSLVGTRVSGTLEPSQYGLKFKKDRPPGSTGGGRPRDPKETAAIQRQHSQHMAVLLLQAKATAGTLAQDDLTPGKIKQLTDWFDDDISGGVERKHPSQHTVKGLPVRNEPVHTGAPDAVTPTASYPEQHPDAGDVPWEN